MRRLMPAVLAIVLVLPACSSASSPGPRPSGTNPGPSTGTTSTATSPTPPAGRVAPAPVHGIVGYLGCSLTWQTIAGYHADGGKRMWPPYEGMGSGEIPVWAEELSSGDLQHWAVFDHALALQPVHAFWIQACFMTSQIGPENVQQAEAMIAHIRDVVPRATIYLSAMNGWDPPDICGKASPAAVANAQQVTDALVADGVALRGPVMPLLPQSETEDACHPDTAGEALLGAALYHWLGRS
jgi:hypothetical protein